MADEKIIIAIVGATASGKSALAMQLAGQLAGLLAADCGGEIVNADSMQLYRGLPILTACPEQSDMMAVPHHGYGWLDASARCSVGRWLGETRDYVSAIHARGKIPILVGGTGLYFRAAMKGIAAIPDVPNIYRRAASEQLANMGGRAFRAMLAGHDPGSAAKLNDGDSQRLVRAMEVFMATGTSLSQWQETPPSGAIKGRYIVIRVAPPRPELYGRINQRYPDMVKNGGIAEAKSLMERGLDPTLPLMKAVGLPPLMNYCAGRIDLDTAIALGCRDTRRYAKRQMTWFNNQLQDNFCEDSAFNEQFSKRFIEKILSKISF